MNNLGNLPVEILSSIVDNLSINDIYTSTLVNKQFYAAANPLLWRAPNVRNSASLFKITTGMFLAQHHVGQHIRKLDLGMALDNSTFMLLLKHAEFLEELKIRQGELITDEGFQNIPQHCPNLKSLYLHDVFITQQSMLALGQHCCQLYELTLSHCLNLSPHSFSALSSCTLKSLTLISPTYCQDSVIASEVVGCLTRLNCLNSLSITFGPANFTQCLLTMNNTDGAAAYPQLSHLFLEHCGKFDDQHIIPFIKLHPKLIRLYLSQTGITDDTIYIISTFLPCITELGISFNPQITTRAIRQLIWNRPLLSHIVCQDCAKTKTDFPEAGDQDTDGLNILCLGSATLNKIRLGPDQGESGLQ